MSLPQIQQAYYPLTGGLDQVTPAISVDPGKVIDSQNYEPMIAGGYRRINGYERYDGHASPSAATYTLILATITGAATAGATLTGGTSGATGVVFATAYGNSIIVTAVTGAFVANESLKISGTTVATSTSSGELNGAPLPADDANYSLLAANYYRNFISAVPGSGPVRGVWVYNNAVYAFRDNTAGTAGLMYQATPAGWSLINFGYQIQFTSAASQISAGNTITGGTSGATATVTIAMLRQGTWTSSGSIGLGTLIITPISGTFISGEALKVGGVVCATSSSTSSQITRLPGGQMEFSNGNFVGSIANMKMYGCDGVNKAFEFDGANYAPITTGMATDTPSHIVFYQLYLWLSFQGSVQFSALGNPYTWTAVLGAGEVDTGYAVTGMLPQASTIQGPSMAIFTQGKTFVLYGSSAANFALLPSMYDLGYESFTCQQVGNSAYGVTGRGVQSLITTLTYGDFDYESVSHLIQPLMAANLGLEISSTTSRIKNQYRVYWSNGYGLVVGLNGNTVTGCMPLNYGLNVRTICTANLSSGAEVTYFGSDNGFVYQDNVGASFDGGAIEAWCRLTYNNVQSPMVIKRFRRGVFQVATEGYASVNITYDLGYGNSDAQQSAIKPSVALTGAGGYWDQFTWDGFEWDTQVVTTASVSVEGSSTNIGFLFYSNGAQYHPHTIQGATLTYSPRRMTRMDS